MSFPVESSSSHQSSYSFKTHKVILKCEPETQVLSDLELILQYLVFLRIPNDHSAPAIVRLKASKLHNVLKAGT